MIGVTFSQTCSLYALNGGSKFDEASWNHWRLKNTYTWNSIHCNFHYYAKQRVGWQLFHAPQPTLAQECQGDS